MLLRNGVLWPTQTSLINHWLREFVGPVAPLQGGYSEAVSATARPNKATLTPERNAWKGQGSRAVRRLCSVGGVPVNFGRRRRWSSCLVSSIWTLLMCGCTQVHVDDGEWWYRWTVSGGIGGRTENIRKVCSQGCNRAWTKVDGVHSLLCMKWAVMLFICTLVTLQESGVHTLLMASIHFLFSVFRTTPLFVPEDRSEDLQREYRNGWVS